MPETRASRPVAAAEVDLGGTRVTIFCAHLENGLGPRYLRHGLGDVPGMIRAAAPRRAALLEALLHRAAETPGPVVLAGDFNTPPRGRLYGRLRGAFRDAFAEAGWGFGYTFRADVPVVRIDDVWCGDGVAVKACRTVRLAGSDHRPVVADLVIPAQR